MKKNVGFKKIMFLFIFVLVLTPIILLSLMSMIISRNSAELNYKGNGDTLLDIAVQTVDNRVNEYIKTLKLLSDEGNFYDSTDLKENLKLLDENDDSILNIYYADELNGGVLQSLDHELPDGYNPKTRSWYIDSMAKKNETVIGSPYVDAATGKNIITISKAVVKEGNPIGVVGMDVELTELAETLSSLKYGRTGQVMISSSDGLVISNTDISKVGSQEPLEYDIWDDILNNKEGKADFTYNSTKYSAYYKTSDASGWKIILKTESNELRENEKKQFAITILLISIILIVIIILVNIATKRIYKFISRIVECFEKAAKGDFKEIINVNSIVKEVNLLQESFNDMRDNLNKLVSNVDNSLMTVEETVGNSIVMGENISMSIEQVSNTMSEISEGTAKSAEGLGDISSEMSDLATSINLINNDTHNVNKAAIHSNELGRKGIEIANIVMNKSNETKNSTQEVNKVVNEVSQSIEKIADINSTINAITEQTNMLALNAAIESARAGEAGKGFSIVAEEIRKLAEETAVSSKNIDSIINEISEKSKAAVSKVSATNKVVIDQEESVLESQKIFAEIVSDIESLSKKVNNIADGITKISNMKDNVLERVDNLSALLEETAAGSEEVTASAQEISSLTESFVNDLGVLKEQSDEVKEELGNFKFE